MTDFKDGIIKPALQDLPPVSERLTYIYLEHCVLSRDDGALTATYKDGVVYIPSCSVSVLLLGPGVDVTSKALGLIADSAITAVWVGEHGVRYYAHGRALSNHTRLLEKQAALYSNTKLHLAVVRKMYEMRFPNEDVSTLTLQQLRGREGARVRRIYRDFARLWNVEWNGRNYDPTNFSASDKVNQALSAGNVCLYGLATAVIVSLGCSPGLGFIHVGHELSFAYDIADLYKAEYTIPLAFELASKDIDDIEGVTRRALRDSFAKNHLIEQMVKDIKYLLDVNCDDVAEPLYLWDNLTDAVQYGIQYTEHNYDGCTDNN